jgi:hypothetical protein
MSEPKEHPKWAKAAALVVSEPTLALAAKEAGVSLRTLERWRKEPGFRRLEQQARQGLLEGFTNWTLKSLSGALAALLRGLKCGKTALEVRAALGIIGTALRANEQLDLAAEVEELKAHVAEVEKRLDMGGG